MIASIMAVLRALIPAVVRLLEHGGAATGTGDLLLDENGEPGRQEDGVAVDREVGVVAVPVEAVGLEPTMRVVGRA
ncbi:hypothetical protein [Streptomyces flaveolus]|uniref:hypothetical protein n=1 Tax=Streptomyces flaveolus TaxID=67297 RepID=UPI0016716B2B|nr:hypothetical protein [Streptomyces flaveolus]GGQ96659.1 hypothetical protein GCM10010216_68810 [Streptomyces flaveolus]